MAHPCPPGSASAWSPLYHGCCPPPTPFILVTLLNGDPLPDPTAQIFWGNHNHIHPWSTPRPSVATRPQNPPGRCNLAPPGGQTPWASPLPAPCLIFPRRQEQNQLRARAKPWAGKPFRKKPSAKPEGSGLQHGAQRPAPSTHPLAPDAHPRVPPPPGAIRAHVHPSKTRS